MMPAVVEKLYPFRWAILLTAVAVHVLLQVAILIVPGMAPLLMSPDVGLDITEFAMIATMPYLTGFLFGMVSGSWADRKSIRFVMIIGLAAATFGAFLRFFIMDFPVMLVGSFIMGFALAALNANSPKLFRLWFPGKMTSIAMGVYIFGATLGGAIGLMVGPTLPSAADGFLIGGVCCAVALVLWILLGKTFPGGESENDEPAMQALGELLKNKWVWLISFVYLFAFASTIVESDYLVNGLVEISGDPATAGLMGSVNMIAVGIGCIIMPIVIAPFKNLKPIFFGSCILFMVTCITVFLAPFGPLTWVLLISQGVFMGVIMPMGKVLPALIPDVKPEHLGAVGGIQSSMQNLGAFLIPAYVVAPICSALFDASAVSLLSSAGICAAISGFLFLFMPKSTSTTVEVNTEAASAE